MDFNKLENEIRELMPIAYSKKVPVSYTENNVSIEDVEATLRKKFKELCAGTYGYKENKYKIFQLITSEIAEILPKTVAKNIEAFADVKTYGQGSKPKFTLKLGKKGVKRFVTAVGLGGIYERVRLDKTEFTVNTKAFGGAVYIEFEQYLDGAFDFYELTQILIDSIEQTLYGEIKKAFDAAIATLPSTQKDSGAGIVETSLGKLKIKAKAFGEKVVLVCTETFAATLPTLTDGDKEDKRASGFVKKYNGMDVVILENGYDEDGNLVFADDTAYIFATGGSADEKIVKVGIEGDTIINEVTNSDASMEFQAYQKLGVAVLSTEGLFTYTNTSLSV